MNDNKIEAPLLEVYETEDIKRRQEEREEEDDAKTRQTFDPINKIYDDRKRRVTDLAECSRVTLPKPMQIEEEALIEIRRNMHKKIFSQHREENTDNGKQESNLSEEERKGLRSILKRIREGEILVMKTDKSGKFCIVSQADYIKMGEVHTKNDKKISRDNVIQIEKALNGHCMAWCKTWDTGRDHKHNDRVIPRTWRCYILCTRTIRRSLVRHGRW